MSKVKANDTVEVHYTGKLKDGQIFDSSIEREPLKVTLGQKSLIAGFENGLIDMAVNDKKTIVIPMEEAYGSVNEEFFQKVPLTDLPEEIKPEVGMALMAKNSDGTERQLKVAAVNEDHIVIDANHPLAGQELIFDLELVSIA
ncbi:peptidylprolyl isomerase [Cellulophaga baltica]|uniref:FKBP-type peptidyl-prolyl cis-trans isomerase n=1 Tax=Cellulophaga TaxID=104264 RepID=UPI001C06C667|nr:MULTISPECIES: peptidylprolyl isomerase [Cellulophaga]MBU2996258.1 peptidylprolyl isomerase [Cellulophaga baltica]MDO6767653.1 peptidylprolyl isomerase [Cellulophaga sp. 1_MG-2023]